MGNVGLSVCRSGNRNIDFLEEIHPRSSIGRSFPSDLCLRRGNKTDVRFDLFKVDTDKHKPVEVGNYQLITAVSVHTQRSPESADRRGMKGLHEMKLFVEHQHGIDAGIGNIEYRLVVELTRDKRAGSEEHTSELQSQSNLVCRLLLEK